MTVIKFRRNTHKNGVFDLRLNEHRDFHGLGPHALSPVDAMSFDDFVDAREKYHKLYPEGPLLSVHELQEDIVAMVKEGYVEIVFAQKEEDDYD